VCLVGTQDIHERRQIRLIHAISQDPRKSGGKTKSYGLQHKQHNPKAYVSLDGPLPPVLDATGVAAGPHDLAQAVKGPNGRLAGCRRA